MADDLEYTPSDEEESKVNTVKSWWKNAKKAKANRKAVTDKCYRYYRGEHYTEAERLKKYGPKSTRNYIFSSIEDALSLLTDSRPVIDAWPRSGMEDVPKAAKAKQVLDWVWQVTEMDRKLPLVLRDYLISGVGWLKVSFDPDINYPKGEIVVEVVHPDFMLVDPDATSMETAKYIMQATPTPLWMIRKMYPEKGKYVKADDTISDDSEEVRKSAEYNNEAMGYGTASDAKELRAWVIECWIRDDATFDEEELDEETGETVTVTKQKYPNGRRLVVGGDVLLTEDENNPFNDGQFPYVMFPNYEQTDNFWPLGDVEHLIETNNDINKIVSRLNDYIKNTCHTYVVYDSSCGIDDASMNNIEGAIIKKEPSGQIGVHPPPPWPGSVFDWLTICKSDLEVISGIREVLQGRSPSAGESGAAFERLQEFALARIRKKSRSVNAALIQLGRLLLSRIRQFYTEPRMIRITGEMAQPPMMQEQGMMPGMGQPQSLPYSFTEFNARTDMYRDDAVIDPMTGEVVQPPSEVELDIVLEVGVAASITRNREKNDAMMLLQAGIIDKDEVARRFDIRNYQQIKARMMQEQIRMMRLQAQIQAEAQIQAQAKQLSDGMEGLAPTERGETPDLGQMAMPPGA